MVEVGTEGVEFIAVNTDLQSLEESSAHVDFAHRRRADSWSRIGRRPVVGRAAALHDDDRIKSLVKGSDLVFVTAGAGGGTGTGAAPIVAQIAREIGALTSGLSRSRSGSRGSRRASQAMKASRSSASRSTRSSSSRTTGCCPCSSVETTMVDAFRVADDVLRQGVQGI